jgi:hypothetical protein
MKPVNQLKIVTVDEMVDGEKYRWAGNKEWSVEDALTLTSRTFTKRDGKVMDNRNKRDVTGIGHKYNDVFILASDLEEE